MSASPCLHNCTYNVYITAISQLDILAVHASYPEWQKITQSGPFHTFEKHFFYLNSVEFTVKIMHIIPRKRNHILCYSRECPSVFEKSLKSLSDIVIIIQPVLLSHFGRDNIAAIFQTTYSSIGSGRRQAIIWTTGRYRQVSNIRRTLIDN